MATLKPALAIRSRLANLVMASTYGVLKLSSSILAGEFLGIAPSLIPASINLITEGRAEPPNFSLNLKPFQLHGLWLEVFITPPEVSQCLARNETAGVGM